MTINTSVTRSAEGNLLSLDLSLSKDSIQDFQTILNRALNCNPDAPVEWKELSDMLDHGRILQDYAAQYKRLSKEHNNDYHSQEEQARLKLLIEKYGMDEWKLYLFIRHEISLNDWEKKMKVKYPEKG